MTAQHATDVIRCNKTTLQDILSANRRLILNKVFENNDSRIITKREYNNLKDINNENTEGHVIHLVDTIMNKGEDTCRAFIRLLQTDEEIKITFPDLEKIQWDNTSPSRPLGLPDSTLNGSNPAPSTDLSEAAPVQESKIPKKVTPAPVEESKRRKVTPAPVQESKRRKKGSQTLERLARGAQASQDDQYQLTSTPIGLCVIINNDTFEDGTSRDGTNKDADSLAEVFSWLGFKVLMCKDQTMDQMDKALKFFASLKDLPEQQKCNVKEWSGREFTDLKEQPQHGDAFVCCLLSHGLSGVVKGIDRLSLPIDEITSHFNGDNCPALISKPKVFFIQACQGEKKQHGLAADCAEADLQADTGPVQVFIPVEADFLVAISTVDNYVSFRHPKDGSWFIQSLCQELKEGCQRGDDIMAIICRVNYDVSQKEGDIIPGTKKQMPEAKKYTLRKKLVFSPPENNPPQETVV